MFKFYYWVKGVRELDKVPFSGVVSVRSWTRNFVDHHDLARKNVVDNFVGEPILFDEFKYLGRGLF